MCEIIEKVMYITLKPLPEETAKKGEKEKRREIR